MEITVELYTDKRFDVWNAFVEHSNNGTIFHRQDFLAYHPEDRFQFHHLLFYRGKTLIAVLPGGVTGDMFKSPVGASFGGFVVAPYLGIEDADKLVKSFIRYCASQKIKEIYLTPPMQVYSNTFDEVMDYSLHYNHFITISSLYSSIIDFNHIKGREKLSYKTRYNVKRALAAGVTIRASDDLDVFYPILIENKKKFNAIPTHTLEELKKIESLVPGGLMLFMAYKDEVPIAGELLFAANRNCVLNFYTMHLVEYKKLNAVSALVEYSISYCAEKGYKYFDYGVSADTFSHDPMEPSWSLIQFKESMRACGCQRKVYYRRVF